MHLPENENVELLEDKEQPCPECGGELDYCYDYTDNEWQCADCNARWFVPLVRAWSRIEKLTEEK